MTMVNLTYDQANAIGMLVRDERPEQVTISNPREMERCTVFASFWDENQDVTQHTVHTDGTVETLAAVTA